MGKAFDVFVSALVMFYFAGYLNIHSDLVGLHEPPIPVAEGVGEFWDLFFWAVFGALVLDILLKYRKVRDPELFVRKHWLEIVMLCLMPVFAGFKVAKLSVKLVKGLKLAKSGFKAAHGAKKMSKARS